jgi:hypothetical protein
METNVATGGARFLDAQGRDRGWASKVAMRVHALSQLTVLDVTTSEPGLLAFLRTLDRDKLTVEHTDDANHSYTFSWASGYDNGGRIRIQGAIATGAAALRARRAAE